jgi:hypothetical protein
MLYPKTVDVSDEQMARLIEIYKTAYKRIAVSIEGATSFGKYYRKEILKQIDEILKELGVDIQKFVEVEMTEFYKKGAGEAVTQLEKIGAELSVTKNFNQIHKEAISNLVDDIGQSFANTLTAVKRNATNIMNQAAKEEIMWKMAEGRISGETLTKIRGMVKGVFREQGVFYFIDKGNHRWELDRYTEMLIRTKAVEARNRGLVNRVVENDYDLVQVSDHFNECELCHPWEGKILSLTGRTSGYPTLDEATAAGLFHPNCRHAINTINLKLAKETNAYNINTGKYE